MFENLRLRKLTEKSIILQTRKGSEIKNLIDVDPDYYHTQIYKRLLNRHKWEERKPATGGYNCIGHIWACRRTGVFEDIEKQLETIRKDDGYRIIETPIPGDLVLYWEANRPIFLHVGIILEMRDGMTKESPKIPWVLSKMDSTSGEVFHHYQNVTFIEGVPHRVEFWTDR